MAICLIAGGQFALHANAHVGPQPNLADDFTEAGSSVQRVVKRLGQPAELPDIYYIILDGYARADILRDYYDFDNTPFLQQLRDRGLFVADRSNSNYTLTYLSLASSLNMRDIHQDLDARNADDPDRAWAHALLWNHRVGRMLQAVGYQYVHLQTNWTGTQNSDIADLTMPKTLPEYDIVLANTTMLKPLMSMRLLPKLTGPTGGDLHRYTFDTLERLARTEDAAGPRFVFAHLICPHPPHVIDRDGNVRESPARDAQEFSSMPLWRDHEGYLGQMEFCNRRVVDIVERAAGFAARGDPHRAGRSRLGIIVPSRQLGNQTAPARPRTNGDPERLPRAGGHPPAARTRYLARQHLSDRAVRAAWRSARSLGRPRVLLLVR